MFHLVATQRFGQYMPGQRITDQNEIAAALAEHAACVVQVQATEESAEPEPTQPKGKRKPAE